MPGGPRTPWAPARRAVDASMTRAWVGTSGWSYDHWEGVLYPPGLPAARRRDVYAAEFDTVELNASFYRWPGEASWRAWGTKLPPGFRMVVKAPRGLTHARRLYAPEPWMPRFAAAYQLLGEHGGPLLVQLDPRQERDDARLDHFLAGLPVGVRAAMELRHPSWQHPDVWSLLERRGAAYVVLSGAGLPCHLVATTDFVYVRLHGPSDTHMYAGSYPEEALSWWAERAHEWLGQGRDVYAYFNNDGYGHAVHNARRLRQLLG